MMTVADLKLGQFFKLTPTAHAVYVRGKYDRAAKRFSVYKFHDVNFDRLLRGTATVTIDFDF